MHIPAPKMKLPGHEESYNPPPEYLPTEAEVWCVCRCYLLCVCMYVCRCYLLCVCMCVGVGVICCVCMCVGVGVIFCVCVCMCVGVCVIFLCACVCV